MTNNTEISSFESTQEFIDMWLKVYGTNTGGLIEMPSLGPAREKSEKMMKIFSAFVNVYASGMDSRTDFLSVSMEAMRNVQEKIAADVEWKIRPENNKDLYRIWIETYSETFKEFLKSSHFASDMGKLTSHLMDFQKYNREIFEENYLRSMDLPTKTEIDEINKELYSLKKTVKELTSQIKELKEIK